MKRDILADLLAWKEKKGRKPLILNGARQVGKTYSLKEFAKQYFPNYLYLNFEDRVGLKKIFDGDLEPQTIIQRLSVEFEKKISQDDLIIFDEIQECPRAITSLKYFCEKLPEYQLIGAGSLLGVKLNELSYPVGKVDHLEMYPICFREFLQALDKDFLIDALDEGIKQKKIYPELHEKLWQLLKTYFISGGLPEVVMEFIKHQDDLVTAFEQVRKKQTDLITDYLADMSKHAGKENAVHLQKLWQNIAEQLSRVQDDNAAKFKFKHAVPEKNRYSRLASTIDWLAASGLIYKVPILDKIFLPLKANINESSFKLFIFDIGILGALIDLSPKSIFNYDYGTYKGFFAENFVLQELRKYLTSYKPIFSWQENQSEIEFLFDNDGEFMPLEVKSGHITKSRSLFNFREKYKNKISTIFSAQNLNINLQTGIYKIPLYLAGNFKEFLI